MKSPMSVIQTLPTGESRLAVIDLHSDVLYTEKDKSGRLIFHTLHGEYRAIADLDDLENHIEDFWQLDGSNVVNMSKVKGVGRHLKAYFDDFPTEQSKFASISWMFMHLLQDIVHQRINHNRCQSIPGALPKKD